MQHYCTVLVISTVLVMRIWGTHLFVHYGRRVWLTWLTRLSAASKRACSSLSFVCTLSSSLSCSLIFFCSEPSSSSRYQQPTRSAEILHSTIFTNYWNIECDMRNGATGRTHLLALVLLLAHHLLQLLVPTHEYRKSHHQFKFGLTGSNRRETNRREDSSPGR